MFAVHCRILHKRKPGAALEETWRGCGGDLARQLLENMVPATSLRRNDPLSSQNMRSSQQKTNRDSTSSQGTSSAATFASSLPSAVVCCHDDDAVLEAVVSKMVKNTIFPKKQFIILDKELETNSKLATKCLKALHMEKNQWHLVKDLIRKRLNSRRNNCQLSIRRSIKRKCPEELFTTN